MLSKILGSVIFFILYFLKPSEQYEKLCTINDGRVNETYRREITSETSVLFLYSLDPYLIRDPLSLSIRFEASTGPAATLSCPLLFTIGQFQEMSNFQLPYIFKGSSDMHYSAGKTLCVSQNLSSQGRNVTVRVSTCSMVKINFDFRLSIAFDLLKADGTEITAYVTPTKSTFYKYLFNSAEDTRIITLIASSFDLNCLTLSVQDLACPIFDKESNVQHAGYWQTMTTKGAMTVSKKDFPVGFVIVLVLHHDNSRCSKIASTIVPQSQRTYGSATASLSKTVRISLRKERNVPRGFFFLALMIPVLCTFLVIILTCLLYRNRHNWLHKMTRDTFRVNHFLISDDEELTTFTHSNSKQSAGTVEKNGRRITETDLDAVFEEDLSSLRRQKEKEEEEPIKRTQSFPHHLEKPSGLPPRSASIWQWKAGLNIASLQRKDHVRVMKGANRFYWTVVIVSIFYAIPVYQLILHYLRVVHRTGEFDICYYNYLCSYRLWIFSDFNHFWSNISYAIFGIAFNFIVGRRERNFRLHNSQNKEVSAATDDGMRKCCKCACVPEKHLSCCCAPIIHARIDHGVSLHFGVFYAMGLALIMEGFLSAAYHLCPNQSNFQFDTCFMYVISVLTILKIYQFRHPVHLGANQVFGILALFVSASVVGLILEVYDSSNTVLTIFRWTFYVGFITSMVLLSIHIYAIGYIKDDDNGKVLGSMDLLTNLNQLPRTVQIDRLILPIISLSLSIGIVIYSEVTKVHFATYLLYTLIANVLGTSIYYIGIMKPLHGEFKNWTWVQPLIYFMSSMVLGTIAIYYFLNVLTQWEVSPSASRAINEECTRALFPFLPFYDNHDIWHYLSAGALFFAFMGLLIVDDDLLTTPQTEIPMF